MIRKKYNILIEFLAFMIVHSLVKLSYLHKFLELKKTEILNININILI